MAVQGTRLTGEKILDELKKCGVTHIVWLLGSELRFMYEAMISQKEITLVPFCREGEGVAIAAGLILGGKKPVMLYQNAGLYEAGDSLRLVLDCTPMIGQIGLGGSGGVIHCSPD